ncbi:MAG: HIT family protein [Nanoarchaeota archaeon]|nr:HIT family protein [Nanoarchaeota archaeon]
MVTNQECIFCKIIRGDFPATKLYEDDKVLVMLDIRPASSRGGHTLVIPKPHYELVTDLPDDLMKHTSVILKKVGRALLKFGQGFNILQNNKKVAGQYIPHVHFHLVPRFKDDGITIEKWTAREYPQGKIEKIAEQLRKLMDES